MDPFASRQAYYEAVGLSPKAARQCAKLDAYGERYARQPRTIAEFVAATDEALLDDVQLGSAESK